MESPRVTRIAPDRLGQIGQRKVRFTDFRGRFAAQVVLMGVVLIQMQGRVEVAEGLLVLPVELVGDAAFAIMSRVARVEHEGSVEIGNGLLDSSGLSVSNSAACVSADVKRVQAHDVGIIGNRALVFVREQIGVAPAQITHGGR